VQDFSLRPIDVPHYDVTQEFSSLTYRRSKEGDHGKIEPRIFENTRKWPKYLSANQLAAHGGTKYAPLQVVGEPPF